MRLTLFVVGFSRKVPVGALMLVSDLPTQPQGVKKKLSEAIFNDYTELHLQGAIDSIQRLKQVAATET